MSLNFPNSKLSCSRKLEAITLAFSSTLAMQRHTGHARRHTLSFSYVVCNRLGQRSFHCSTVSTKDSSNKNQWIYHLLSNGPKTNTSDILTKGIPSLDTRGGLVPNSYIKLTSYKNPDFKSIPKLGSLITDVKLDEILPLISEEFYKGNFLTFDEIQKLIIYLSPYPWLSYKVIKLYQTKYSFLKVNDQLIPLLLKLAYLHMDYPLFISLLDLLMSQQVVLQRNILLMSLQVLTKVNDINKAQRVFYIYLATCSSSNGGDSTDINILNTYIHCLFNSTLNISICIDEYTKWVNKGFNYKNCYDLNSFLYNKTFEKGNEDDIAKLKKVYPKLENDLNIQFGKKCSNITERENYLRINELVQNLLNPTTKEEVPTKLNPLVVDKNMLYLHLKFHNYEEINNILQHTKDKSQLEPIINHLITHLEKFYHPEEIFHFYQQLRAIGFRFNYKHLLPYWRGLIRCYIHSGDKIHLKLLKNVNHNSKLSFLTKILKIRSKNSPLSRDVCYYPKISFGNYNITKPYLKNITQNIDIGILPNDKLLIKSIKLCPKDDLDYLSKILLQIYGLDKLKPFGINKELFFKGKKYVATGDAKKTENDNKESDNDIVDPEETPSGTNKSAVEFIKHELDQRTSLIELLELFQLGIKYNQGEAVLCKIYSNYQQQDYLLLDNQTKIKFCSSLIKHWLILEDYLSIVEMLEWLKQGHIVLDGYFVHGVRKSLDRYASASAADEGQIKVRSDVKKYILQTTMELHKISRDQRREMLKTCERNFGQFVKWMEEDVEDMVGAIREYQTQISNVHRKEH